MAVGFPAAFLALGLIPVVVALRLLSGIRVRREVSSTFLYERLAKNERYRSTASSHALLNPILIFEILLILFISFAASVPSYTPGGTPGRTIFLVVDTSPSMLATDGDATRIERARDAAVEWSRKLGAADTLYLWTREEGAAEIEPRNLREAFPLPKLQGTRPFAGSVRVALDAAEAVEADAVVVLTDGSEKLPIPPGERFFPASFGKQARNVGITAASATVSPDKDTVHVFYHISAPDIPGGDEVAISTFRNGEETTVSERIEPPGKDYFPSLPIAEADGYSVKVSTGAGNGGEFDRFELDDTIFLSIATNPAAIVLITGEDSPAVDKALRASGAGLVEYKLFSENDDYSGYDLVVFAKVGSPPVEKAAASVAIAPSSGRAGEYDILGEINPGRPVSGGDEMFAPLFDNAGFEITRASRAEVYGNASVILAAGTDGAFPLIFRFDTTRYVIAFDPGNSNWEKDASYPVFWYRVLANLPGARQPSAIFRKAVELPAGGLANLLEPAETDVSGATDTGALDRALDVLPRPEKVPEAFGLVWFFILLALACAIVLILLL